MRLSGMLRVNVAAALALVCACLAIPLIFAGCEAKDRTPIETDPVAVTDENRETALDFAEAWYGDWTFEDGEMQLASSTPAGRCVGYVEPGTPLANELEGLSSSRESARCVTMLNVPNAEGDSIIVEVEYVATQMSGIDEAMYKELQKSASSEKLIMSFNSDGRIIHIDGLS